MHILTRIRYLLFSDNAPELPQGPGPEISPWASVSFIVYLSGNIRAAGQDVNPFSGCPGKAFRLSHREKKAENRPD